MLNITRVGVDIAKSVFHVHGVDRQDRVQWRGKYARGKWLAALVKRVPVRPFRDVYRSGFWEVTVKGRRACSGAW